MDTRFKPYKVNQKKLLAIVDKLAKRPTFKEIAESVDISERKLYADLAAYRKEKNEK